MGFPCPKCGAEGARGDQCDSCGATYEVTELKDPKCMLPGDNSTPVLKSTKHWFLQLDKLQAKLEPFVAAHDESSEAPWRLNSLRGAQSWLLVFPDYEMAIAFNINSKTDEFYEFGKFWETIFREFAPVAGQEASE